MPKWVKFKCDILSHFQPLCNCRFFETVAVFRRFLSKWGQIKDEKKACVCVSSSRLSHTFSNTLWSRTHYLFMSFSFPLPFSRLMTQQQRTKNLHVMLMEIFKKWEDKTPIIAIFTIFTILFWVWSFRATSSEMGILRMPICLSIRTHGRDHQVIILFVQYV